MMLKETTSSKICSFLLSFQDHSMEVVMSFITSKTEEPVINSKGIVLPLVIHKLLGLILIYRVGNLADQVVSYDSGHKLALEQVPGDNSSHTRLRAKTFSKSFIIDCSFSVRKIPGL